MEPHALRRLIRALVRAPLRAIPRAARIPILRGPARGMRWVVGSATHGCWIVSYERETQDILAGLFMYSSVSSH